MPRMATGTEQRNAQIRVLGRTCRVPAFARFVGAKRLASGGRRVAIVAMAPAQLAGTVAANDEPASKIWSFDEWRDSRADELERLFHLYNGKKCAERGVVVVMAMPRRVYRSMQYIMPSRLSQKAEEFWPGEEPVPMRGSKDVRRWIRDRRWNVRDGYLFELQARYLKLHKITALTRSEKLAVLRPLKLRIKERLGVEGNKFLNEAEYCPSWSGEALIDGEFVELSPLARLFCELAESFTSQDEVSA